MTGDRRFNSTFMVSEEDQWDGSASTARGGCIGSDGKNFEDHFFDSLQSKKKSVFKIFG
jgi:hypothetical protein